MMRKASAMRIIGIDRDWRAIDGFSCSYPMELWRDHDIVDPRAPFIVKPVLLEPIAAGPLSCAATKRQKLRMLAQGNAFGQGAFRRKALVRSLS